MTTTARQNNLILNQDWKRIYQTFKNVDFKSYDFENLRRVIITYLRENYPEDFNDYIESSEYMALIDAVAFLGQSLSFRIDLASRENFIELAERKESVLRLARMLSYNSKRNIAAQGLLKFATVSTTEDILDSNGKNLTNQIISWNDPTNVDWLEQFILVLNSAMADNTEFGRSQGSATIEGILTEQYRFRTTSQDVPIFSYNKTVAGRGIAFEVLSTTFKNAEKIYEEPPVPGNQLGFIYRNDGKGPGSANTGFYLLFKQGSLELADFSFGLPTPNEKVAVESSNINNDDVWLFKLNAAGAQQEEWSQVSNLVGNNIVYNSISNNIRDIYSVVTKEDDKIDLVFSDGVYGNLPQGSFRVYYRVSNGLSYVISPNEMKGINITVPYLNKNGVEHFITIGLSLQYTISSASASETVDSIRNNAPALFYTQNRMITAEDYNLAPLSSSQDILKVKSINRTSSGISRNYEIIDASGKYSSVNVLADDGFIYKEEIERILNFKFSNRIDIINFIRQKIEPVFTATDVYNFYITKFDKIIFSDLNTRWNQVTYDVNLSTGYFKNEIDKTLLKVGSAATSGLKYIKPGTMVKFVAPEGMAFKKGKLVSYNSEDISQSTKIWTRVIKVVGDGTNAGKGVLTSGLGPITFSDVVPTGSIIQRVVPKFVNDLPPALESEIVNQISQNLNFGLRYDTVEMSWVIITSTNIDLISDFSMGKSGDVSGTNIDSSWIIAFVKDIDSYNVKIRGMDYIFGSVEQNRFYFDKSDRVYNSQLGIVVRDQINVLGVNRSSTLTSMLGNDVVFEIDDSIMFEDGHMSQEEIKLSFSDVDSDGVIDNPEAFEDVVGIDSQLNYLFFKETIDSTSGIKSYVVDIDATDNMVIVKSESLAFPKDYEDGQLIYFYDTDEDNVKAADHATNSFILRSEYKANIGRYRLKFQYIHNASVDRRIDPSSSNIIDVYVLPRAYDTAYRNYLSGALSTAPIPPTNESLRINYGSKLNSIKAISDELIYHPVTYKALFGSTADPKLQAQFKVVKNPDRSINDNNLKVRIVNAINDFFDINNWDFGDRFYLSELVTYILNIVAPDVSNLVIVPRQSSQSFGSLFEIQSKPDEIFISGATVDDIVVVSALTASEIRASVSSIVTST